MISEYAENHLGYALVLSQINPHKYASNRYLGENSR